MKIIACLYLSAAVFFLLLSQAFCGFAEDKPRYISLAPSTTEILYALGLKEQIAGVSTYCNYPAQALTKEKVGDFSHPNIEKILSLQPDYIFCTGLEQAPVIAELRRLHLKVYIADPSTIAELFTSIQEIGDITGQRDSADILIATMQQELDQIRKTIAPVAAGKKPKVFVEIWGQPLTTAGKGSIVDELLSLAGASNIAHDTRRPYCIFSHETVIQRNPDCIILAYMDAAPAAALLKNRFGWDNIAAVVQNRLYNDIDPDLLLRPGPRIVSGLQELCKRLYLNP